MRSSYEKDLEYGFLLIRPFKRIGRYRSGKFVYNAITECELSEYKYLKIHKCRACKKYYVLHKSCEIYFEPVQKKTLPTSIVYSRCKYCVSSSGHDSPLEECKVPMTNVRKKIGMYF
jgi:hypothetical protein